MVQKCLGAALRTVGSQQAISPAPGRSPRIHRNTRKYITRKQKHNQIIVGFQRTECPLKRIFLGFFCAQGTPYLCDVVSGGRCTLLRCFELRGAEGTRPARRPREHPLGPRSPMCRHLTAMGRPPQPTCAQDLRCLRFALPRELP